MSFLIYLHKDQFKAEDPQILDGHLKQDTELTFIDFIPSIIKRSSTSIMSGSEIEYHPFKKMVETANEWLEDHPDYDVINCETIKILFKYNDNQSYYELRFNDIFNYVFGTEKNLLLKALRVWIKKKNLDVQETATNVDAGYSTDSLLSPDTPQQESPKISNLTSVLKRRWTTTQQQLQRLPTKIATTHSSTKNQHHPVEIHSTDHSPKKGASTSYQQQQAFRLQQYSSQSKFFLNKLQRQASCPQSNNFQAAHLQQTNWLAQNAQALKQTHNQTNQQINSSSNQQQTNRNTNQSTNQTEQTQSTTNQRKKIGKSTNLINYIDILPEYNEDLNAENSKQEKFERLDDCLEKLNQLIRDGKIKGTILNVETGCLEASVNWKVDPSVTFSAITSKNVNFLRCFFIENGKQPELNERIQIIDFIPDSIGKGGFFKRPKFENFSLLLPKVAEWLIKNPKYTFKNAQTLDIKLKSYLSQNQTEMIDTKIMFFNEHGDYLRILRLVYSEQVEPDDNQESINEQLVSINQSINNLLDDTQDIEDDNLRFINKNKRNGVLIKQDSDTSGQCGSTDLSKSTFLDKDTNEPDKNTIDKEDKDSKLNKCDFLETKLKDLSKEDRQVYLSSKLFVSQRKNQTINDLKQEIQDWIKNYQIETRPKNISPNDLAKPRILACETMQIFCKQEMNKNNDFVYLQKTAEETFMYNRFGSKNGYIVNLFKVYFDIGFAAYERLNCSVSQKLGQAHKLRRRRLNYSTSVDDEHLINKESSCTPAALLTTLPTHHKMLNRRESVADLYPVTSKKDQLGDLDLVGRLKAPRRKSCIEKYEIKSPARSPMKSPLEVDQQFLKMQDRQIEKKPNDLDAKIETMISETVIDFSILENASQNKLHSSNSSLSTSNSNEETKFLNRTQECSKTLNSQQQEDKSLKQKIKRINNFRPQSIDNLQGDTSNCLLM